MQAAIAPQPAAEPPEPEPFRGAIAIGKPAASREAELALAAGRTLVAYLRTPWQDDQNIESIAFSPDGTLLAAGRKAGVSLWDVATGKRRGVFPVSQKQPFRFFGVRAVAFSPDGTLLAGGDYFTIHVWTVKDGHELRTIKEPSKDISTLRFSPDGITLVSVNSEGTVRAWNARTGAAISVFEERLPIEHDRKDSDLLVAPDGKSVYFTAKTDKKLVKIDLATGKVVRRWDTHPDRTQGLLAFRPDGKALVSAGARGDGRLEAVGPGFGRGCRLARAQPNHLRAWAVSPAGKTLVVPHGGDALELYDTATGRRCGQSTGSPDGMLTYLTFGPTGKMLAGIASSGKAILIWDIEPSAQRARDRPGRKGVRHRRGGNRPARRRRAR